MKVEDIKPINNLILVELVIGEEVEQVETKTESGIIVDTVDKKANQPQETMVACEVIAVSDGVFQDYALQAGDSVLVHKFKGNSMLIDGRAYLLLDMETEVYGIVG